uniref:THAP domain-containing protein 1 n=1 Tax=Gasterosteus aculeatus aculeatus TaxID=481459 RepID=A0AAQ4S430_GASAC
MSESSCRCYCSVPCCSNNKHIFAYLSFHDFPVDAEIRACWVRAIKRDEGPSFKILRGSTYVCSQHFAPEDLCTSASGRTRIKKGATPSRFPWNDWGKVSLPENKEAF